jgi:RNase P protein component
MEQDCSALPLAGWIGGTLPPQLLKSTKDFHAVTRARRMAPYPEFRVPMPAEKQLTTQGHVIVGTAFTKRSVSAA